MDLRTRPAGQPERLERRERGEHGARSAVDQRCLPRLVTCRWPVVGDDRPAPPLPAAGIEGGDQLRRAAAELEKLRPGKYGVWCAVDDIASRLRGLGEHGVDAGRSVDHEVVGAPSCGWGAGCPQARVRGP